MKKIFCSLAIASLLAVNASFAQKPLTENDFYQLRTLPLPEDAILEVGGMTILPDGRMAVATRRGEIWMIENPYQKDGTQPYYKRFAQGLHEPLGLTYRNGSFYTSNRGELTKITDEDGDGRADVYEAVTSLPIVGNYHEYSYGPVFDADGNMLVTLNVGWVGYGASLTKWRGWLVKISPEGKIEPISAGLRSPSSYLINSSGDLFYSENQGDWVASGKVSQLKKGSFNGHGESLKWTSDPASPLKLTEDQLPDTGEPVATAGEKIPHYQYPACWFPHVLMGISTAGMVEDVNGYLGPHFKGQYFVGDQGHSKVMRMQLEKVNGEYQGACFPFREGWASGLLRLEWGLDGSLVGGMTSRGWSSTGKAPYAIQRLVWSGKTPFEMQEIHSKPDGFEIVFTKPVDKETAANPANYKVASFTYKYHHQYGSPIINTEESGIKGIVVSADGRKARLVLDGSFRKHYIYEIKPEGVKSADQESVLHPVGYYTLNAVAPGDQVAASQFTPFKATAAPMNHEHGAMQASTGKTASTGKATTNSKKRVTEMPAEWAAPDQVLTIGTKPGLKFDVTELQVKAGSKVKLVFNNNDDMTHNCVIVAPGSVDEVGQKAIGLGLKGPDMQYVPNSPKVLFHTNLLQPESSESLYFTAPTQPGTYTYVCTYPGHHTLMQGKLVVVK
ncbi:auracyanin family protein [Siphonobacter sp. BAB-5385]|uniref:plastocyanin/azurin family copper-binding protein n=1 Tax=Siphonobacter sp. BAB-5385 TaxID=1864822 RepID=UPI000B9DD986|nr:plastocyanin/azurin family copper-binding protein [Siphonobacter sp. BAB-5385]OZI05463.1 auracyanin family protein [Siphonobacter sp. BAB-5385]